MIHQFKLNGFNIVIDICSGSIHAVDEVAYDIIEKYEAMNHSDIKNFILDKYKNREDVTVSDIEDCFSDIEELKTLYSEIKLLNVI